MNAIADTVRTHIAKARQPDADRRPLRLLTLLWAAVCAVQFVIWALIAVIRLDVDKPWWLWSFAIPGALIAAAWRLTDPRRGQAHT